MSPSIKSATKDLLDKIANTEAPDQLRDLLGRLDKLLFIQNDPDALKVLMQKMNSPDKYIRETAFELSSRISTVPSPALLELGIVDASQTIRWQAYNLVIANPYPELLPLLAGRLKNFDRNKIISVLAAYGSECEPHVLPLLVDATTRLDVIRLLGDVGTEKSVSALSQMIADGNISTVESLQAEHAVSKIKKRMETDRSPR